MDSKIVVSIVGAFLCLAFLWFVGRLVQPLAEPLAWALIIGVSSHPHFERIARHFPGRPGRAAGAMVTVVTLCLILPLSALILALAQNATEMYHQGQRLFQSVGSSGASAFSKLPYADRVMEYAQRAGIDIGGHASEIASRLSGFLLAAASGAVQNVAHFVLTLAMAIFILYFVYRDGERTVNRCVKRFAANRPLTQHYLSQIRGTSTAVVVGTLLTCLAHGVFAGVGYCFADVPAPILCGSLTAVTALIPVVGSAIVWVPLAGYLAITGAVSKAAFLAGWCIVVVGIADHAVRPLTIGATGDIPVLAVILGALGGAEVLGLPGLIVGPIVFGVLVTLTRDALGEREEGEEAAPLNEVSHG